MNVKFYSGSNKNLGFMKNINNFQEFYYRCEQLYETYRSHFLLQGCEIITNFEGNEVDNKCWYCIIKVGNGVHTILAYDYTGETEKPFVVYCDWSQLPGAVGCSGYFSECGEFSHIEEAFHFMAQEPSRYNIKHEEDIVLIYEKDKYDMVLDSQKGLGFLDSVRLVCTDEYYKGKTIEICQPKSYGRTVLYRKAVQ